MKVIECFIGPLNVVKACPQHALNGSIVTMYRNMSFVNTYKYRHEGDEDFVAYFLVQDYLCGVSLVAKIILHCQHQTLLDVHTRLQQSASGCTSAVFTP